MRTLELKHTHILDMSCGVRMVVRNNDENLSWDTWFDKNPEARDKLKEFLVQNLLGFCLEGS
jgi:hypothetical protein